MTTTQRRENLQLSSDFTVYMSTVAIEIGKPIGDGWKDDEYERGCLSRTVHQVFMRLYYGEK